MQFTERIDGSSLPVPRIVIPHSARRSPSRSNYQVGTVHPVEIRFRRVRIQL